MQIAGEGRALIPIRLARSAGAVERFAAAELARYLEAISGAEFRVESGGGHGSAGICVGRTAGSEQVAAVADGLKPDGYVIRSTGDTLFVTGRDARGTLYGVYRLLEELGCRFLAPNFDLYPGGCGEIVPRRERLDLGVLDIVEEPGFAVRRKSIEEGRTHTDERCVALIDWMAKNRMNAFAFPLDQFGQGETRWIEHREALIPELARRGIELEVGGHGYESHLPAPKLAGEHPEWFALKRGARRSDAHASLCDSEPAAVAALIDRVLDFLSACPEVDVFDLWPPDESDCWCECPACRRLGSVPERHMRVVRQVAEAVGAHFPDKTVEFLAYDLYTQPPDTPPPANARMDFCSIRRSFGAQILNEACEVNREYRDALLAWRERCPDLPLLVYSYYRKYSWKSLPVLLPELIAAELAGYYQAGVVGLGSYSEPGDWQTYELQHWLVARLSWDPGEDLEAALSGYLGARYGDSAGSLREALRKAAALWGTAFTGFHDQVRSAEHARQLLAGFGEVARECAAAGAESLSCAFGYARDYYSVWVAAWNRDAAGFQQAASKLEQLVQGGAAEGWIIPIKYMSESIEKARELLGQR